MYMLQSNKNKNKLNKYDVSQYNCVKNLKLFLPDSKSSGSLNTFCRPCYRHPCYSPTIGKMIRYVNIKGGCVQPFKIPFN